MKNLQSLLKNKVFLIVAGAVVVVLILVVVAFLVFGKSSSSNNQVAAEPTPIPVLTLKPSDIGLSFAPAANLQRGTMKIEKTQDISSVDYQLTYTAVVSGEPVARGTIGHVDVKNPGQTITQEMVFGTCSDVCHYDSGISDIKLIVKVTKADKKVYQVELPVPLPTK